MPAGQRQHRVGPAASLPVAAPAEPVPLQRAQQPGRDLRFLALQGPSQHGPHIVLLGIEPLQPLNLALVLKPCRCLRGEHQCPLGMPAPRRLGVVERLQALARVFGNRFLHAQPWPGPGARLGKQALLSQGREVAEKGITLIGTADRLDSIQHTATLEDGQLGEQALLGTAEELVAPVDGGSDRALPIGRVVRAVGEELELAVEPAQQRGRREQADPGSGELDGQRQPVQPSAHLAEDLLSGRVDLESGVGHPGSLGEQPHRSRHGQGWYSELMLAPYPKRRAARRQHGEPRACPGEFGHRCGGGEQVLEVVQDEQEAMPVKAGQ